MSDDSGVMGNLPRSRPGRRSDKRATGGAAASKPASSGAKASASKAASSGSKPRASAGSKPRSSSGAKPRTTTSRARTQRPAAEREPARQPAGDPLTEAVRLAGTVAGAGLKVASGILKRLPRP